MDLRSTSKNKQTFLLLWFLCIIGSLSLLPYVQKVGILPANVSSLKLVVMGTIQAALLFGLICWLSYKILPKTDLKPFFVTNFLKQIAYPAAIAGTLLGFALFFFDKMLFSSSLLSGTHPPFWTGALASLYGGINEEVLLRLFLFTLVYFLFGKCIKIHANNRNWILWTTNIFVALLFGIGHLPAAFKLVPLTSFEIFRVLFLNGLAGVTFGWLYWTRGLWAAMAAHFITDLMIHVFLI